MISPRHLFALLTLSFAALLGAIALPYNALAQTTQSTTERNRQFITKAFAQWSAGGRTFFQDVLAADAVWIIKGTSPAAGTYHNRQDFMDRAVKPFADRMLTPVRPTVKDIWADGDDVIVHWDGVATAADGKPYSNSYVWIFRMGKQRAVEVIAFLDLVPYDDVIKRIPATVKQGDTPMNRNPYVGMWVTADGSIRHELLANGRYDEARGTRQSAYQGRYEISGNRVNYWDDTGFTADGTFVSDKELHHGGMVFHRRK